MNGHLIPYLPMNDSWIALLMILCFISNCFVLAKGKKRLWYDIKEMFDSRPFDSHNTIQITSEDIRFRIILELQLCFFFALFFFQYTSNEHLLSVNKYHSILYLSIFTGIVLTGFLLKTILYLLIRWVFFDRTITNTWIRYHFVTDAILIFMWFPLLLISIYYPLSPDIYLPIAAFLMLLSKSLLFFRWTKLFYFNLYSKVYFISYLCALELIPLILVVVGLIHISDFLQLKS